MTQSDIDSLADIMWWIKGYIAADKYSCPFNEVHIEALRKARINNYDINESLRHLDGKGLVGREGRKAK